LKTIDTLEWSGRFNGSSHSEKLQLQLQRVSNSVNFERHDVAMVVISGLLRNCSKPNALKVEKVSKYERESTQRSEFSKLSPNLELQKLGIVPSL